MVHLKKKKKTHKTFNYNEHLVITDRVQILSLKTQDYLCNRFNKY